MLVKYSAIRTIKKGEVPICNYILAQKEAFANSIFSKNYKLSH